MSGQKGRSVPLSCTAVRCGCDITRIPSGTRNAISRSRNRCDWNNLTWIEENAERLNIDTDKMAIMGESAGGHLAINTCLKDEKQRMKLAVSVYGVMDLSKAEDTPYHWDYSLYQMAEEQRDYIMNRLFRFKELNDSMNDLYLQNGESTLDGEVSPLFSKHLDCLPKVLMIEAEFDYFRVCNQEFENVCRKQAKISM